VLMKLRALCSTEFVRLGIKSKNSAPIHTESPCLSSSAYEPILRPVAPHSVDSEFLRLVDLYRGIVEEVVCPAMLFLLRVWRW
jgi:hypothetical protein